MLPRQFPPSFLPLSSLFPPSFLPLSSLFPPSFVPKSFPFILLQALLPRQKPQPLCNQANPSSFRKTPGVGYPQCNCKTPGLGFSVLSVNSVVNCVFCAYRRISGPGGRPNSLVPGPYARGALGRWLPSDARCTEDRCAHAFDARSPAQRPSRGFHPYENQQSFAASRPTAFAWASYLHFTRIPLPLFEFSVMAAVRRRPLRNATLHRVMPMKSQEEGARRWKQATKQRLQFWCRPYS
jgi:hypothetical protein